MAIKDVLQIGNPKLRKISSPIKQYDSEAQNIEQDLKDTLQYLQKTKKIGRALAAPQIGHEKKLIYLKTPFRETLFINPKIINRSKETFDVWDSCFSFDVSFFVRIKRHGKISIEYQDKKGKKIKENFTGDFSELLQHEIDHLDGILAVDYLKKPKDFIMRSEWEKLAHPKKRIGILGGISHESTQKYYDLIHKKYFKQFGDYYYPEVVIYSLDFQKFTDFEDNKDFEGYVQYILKGIRALEDSKVDFIIMAANSPHSVYEQVSKLSSVPMLSIAEVTAKEAKKRKLKKLLLLGIKHTMQSTFYQNICRKEGIDVIVPNEKEQNRINKLIFDELCKGNFANTVKKEFLNIIMNYTVDGVILGCTELPLILKRGDMKVDFLNTLDLHVTEALRYAIKEFRFSSTKLNEWRRK